MVQNLYVRCAHEKGGSQVFKGLLNSSKITGMAIYALKFRDIHVILLYLNQSNKLIYFQLFSSRDI
jgi:hypothetical protein